MGGEGMKKTLICILVVTVLLGFATLDKSQAASDTLHVLLTPPGDVNSDGTIDVIDCVVLKKYLIDHSVSINTSNADMNFDRVIDALDLAELKMLLLFH